MSSSNPACLTPDTTPKNPHQPAHLSLCHNSFTDSPPLTHASALCPPPRALTLGSSHRAALHARSLSSPRSSRCSSPRRSPAPTPQHSVPPTAHAQHARRT
eukprot:1529577-Rhodomonas_salina.1